MNKLNNHVTDDQLRVLTYEQEDGVESVEIARHVETCETCQSRLTELTANSQIELEASHLYSGYEPADRHLSYGSDIPSNATMPSEVELDKRLLGPPTHPEMLGRIGRYEIERRIGSGGMGVVFKAIDTELNRPVAVKILAPHLSRNGAARQRFSRESRAAAAVVHEHVVAIHNVDANAEHPYLVMQYVSGESLQSRVDRTGPMSVEQILRIGVQAARGLAAAHQQGIVHRDIKPANILLEDGVERLLITDFGLARTVDDASLTHTGVVAGTPSYMSPEQASGDAVDQRCDLFSLGSVLYFVATGHPPFRAERAMGILHRICHHRHRPVWQVNSAVPDELSAVIDRLLEKRPAKRFASAAVVADVMARILQSLQNRRPSFMMRLRSWRRRHRLVSWMAVAVFLVVAGFVVKSFWNPERNDRSTTSTAATDTQASTMEPLAGVQNTAPQNPSAAAFTDAEDRNAFDERLNEIANSLQALEVRQDSDPSDPFQEFQLELRSLEQSLHQIDPTNNP